MKNIFTLLVLFLGLSLLSACEAKKAELSPQEKVKIQYKQLEDKTWADFNHTEETILEIAYKAGNEGATINTLRHEQEIVDKFIKLKLIQWDSKALKYIITEFGRGTFESGQAIKNAEAAKPESLRNKDVLAR